MHESVFTNIEISAAGPATPLIGQPAREVCVEAVVECRDVKWFLEAIDLLVDVLLPVTQWLKFPSPL